VDLDTFRQFNDRPGSPFYCAEGATPGSTWYRIFESMQRTLARLIYVSARGSVDISPNALQAWHANMFGSTFPSDAGRLRYTDASGNWEHVEYMIGIGTERTAKLSSKSGAHPVRIPDQLESAFSDFHAELARMRGVGEVRLYDAVLVTSTLYSKLLRVHPFVDGNLRAAFIALQAAQLEFGLPMVQFPDLAHHDACIGFALRNDSKQTYEPLARHIEELLRAA
jgi:fido (protein-threonine AMPylation protein)